jgi:hypothetical protein
MDESNAGRAVGIVLDRRNLSGNALLVTLEIDDTIATLVASTPVTHSDASTVVPATIAGPGVQQGFFGTAAGNFRKIRHAHAASTVGSGFVLLDSHCLANL